MLSPLPVRQLGDHFSTLQKHLPWARTYEALPVLKMASFCVIIHSAEAGPDSVPGSWSLQKAAGLCNRKLSYSYAELQLCKLGRLLMTLDFSFPDYHTCFSLRSGKGEYWGPLERWGPLIFYITLSTNNDKQLHFCNSTAKHWHNFSPGHAVTTKQQQVSPLLTCPFPLLKSLKGILSWPLKDWAAFQACGESVWVGFRAPEFCHPTAGATSLVFHIRQDASSVQHL